MPRGKKNVPAAPKKAAHEEGLSKMEAVRRALAKLGNDAKPQTIKDYLNDVYGIHMEATVISSYKTSIAKRAAGQSAMVRKPKSPLSPMPQPTLTRANGKAGESIRLQDIQAVKALTDRLGADGVHALVDVLEK